MPPDETWYANTIKGKANLNNNMSPLGPIIGGVGEEKQPEACEMLWRGFCSLVAKKFYCRLAENLWREISLVLGLLGMGCGGDEHMQKTAGPSLLMIIIL